jgi:GABA permease
MTSESSVHLQQNLKPRHLGMIAIGGVIGAGLFVGSSSVISKVGPGAFLTYALAGLLIVMVMRMLGEMAAANPSSGSFSDYARLALGGWAGFAVAWLYWYFWVIVIGFEAVAAAGVLQKWFPNFPLWSVSLSILLLMTTSNLFSVRSFGEFEYWFSGIKILAILIFLVSGSLYVFGVWPGHAMDISNLVVGASFLPNGISAIFTAVVVVVFSMVGAEIVTIAAAETPDPANTVIKATRSVVLRILLFYVGSAFLLTIIVPWSNVVPGSSPFVTAFERMGIRWAGDIMNGVVLTAILSCLNSGIYTASRMLFVLASRSEAPASFTKTSKTGVPVSAILASTAIGYLAVVAAYVSPTTVFQFLLNSSGAVIIFVYILIAFSQLLLRPRTKPENLKIKMWFYPTLTLFSIFGMMALLVMMALDSETRSQLALSLLSAAFVIVAYLLMVYFRKRTPQAAADAQST